jgi:hypothetical protein
LLIKEVDFLESVIVPDAPEDDSERDAVGRIDTVLVHPDKPNEWCALELQAVSAPAVIPSRTVRVGLSPGVSRQAAEKSGVDLKCVERPLLAQSRRSQKQRRRLFTQYSDNGKHFLVFGRLTERAPPKRYIYWSQQLLLIFYSASGRGDHQGNTMIPYLS